MLLKNYLKYEDYFEAVIILSSNNELSEIARIKANNLEDVVNLAIKYEEKFYDFEFSKETKDIMHKDSKMQILVRENPTDGELLKKYFLLQVDMEKSFAKSGFTAVRRITNSFISA